MVATVLALLTGLAVALVPAQARAAEPTGRVTAWLPYWDQARALQSFSANADLYRAASPFWYELASNGSISRYPGAEDAPVLSTIRGKGVPVIPTITNNFDPARVSALLATEATRAAHVQQLVALVQALGYDGIDIDYESLNAADRDRFSAFIAALASALHAQGKLLTIAVHPKTAEPGTWSGPQAQDYAALGRAVDRFRVMAYDYSWATSPAGPIAPLSWVDQVAAFAASVVAPAKVELGMSLYGYDWAGSQAEGVMHDQVMSRMAAAGATRTWDATAAEPRFSYTSGGTARTVYYADAQSVVARLALVDKYSLAGAAFWRLGGEDPQVWPAVRSRWGTTSTSTATTGTTGTTSPTAAVPAADTTAADTTAPTVPAGLTARGGIRRIALSWSSASDAGSGVQGYEILRATSSGGTLTTVASTASLTWTDTAVRRDRTYWYAVRAYDAAGNRSASSGRVSAVSR